MYVLFSLPSKSALLPSKVSVPLVFVRSAFKLIGALKYAPSSFVINVKVSSVLVVVEILRVRIAPEPVEVLLVRVASSEDHRARQIAQ